MWGSWQIKSWKKIKIARNVTERSDIVENALMLEKLPIYYVVHVHRGG